MTLSASVRVEREGPDPFVLDVSVEAADGEVVGILGPNGAGKTTLLRAVAGLAPLAGGRVAVDDFVLEDAAQGVWVPPERRPVGVVFQDYLLFPHLSALENVAFGLRARGTPKAGARQAAGAWLERVGLSDVAGRRPKQLSGGQQQRVALARALATEPRLLLLDEPLAALDVEVRAAVRRDLRAILGEFAGARLLITHDPLEALTLADRLVILDAGRVVQEGNVAEVARRPRSTWVASFVGLNLLAGQGEGDHVVLDGGQVLHAPDAGRGPVHATIHPRSVALHRHRPEGSARNVWEGVAGEIDLQGDRARIAVTGATPGSALVAEVTPAAIAELSLGDGGPVWVSVKASEVEVYPR